MHVQTEKSRNNGGAQLRTSFPPSPSYPLNTKVLWCSRGFRETLMMPRDANLSDDYTPDHFSFLVWLHVWNFHPEEEKSFSCLIKLDMILLTIFRLIGNRRFPLELFLIRLNFLNFSLFRSSNIKWSFCIKKIKLYKTFNFLNFSLFRRSSNIKWSI